MSAPIMIVGDVTDPKFGAAGTVLTGASTVMVGASYAMAAQMGSIITSHGNPAIPVSPGFNPTCAAATVLMGTSTVMVENMPLATLDYGQCTCGLHQVIATGESTVIVGP
jgi:hypothetical protein